MTPRVRGSQRVTRQSFSPLSLEVVCDAQDQAIEVAQIVWFQSSIARGCV